MRFLILSSRILGGLVFIFSGFVKGVDPVGSQIKFSDYLTAAGMTVPDNLLLIAAMLLCALEFLIGIALVTGAFYRAGVIGYVIFMSLFTPLTLVLAIFNPVSDCGCFGDALLLTNWETFFKNIVLLVPGILMVLTLRKQTPKVSMQFSATIIGLSTLLFFLFMIYNIRYNPIIDFRPYKIGTNIPESMSIPEGAPGDVYDIKLLYEKDGLVKEFTLQNYPADDSAWIFVDQKSELVSKGYEPPIKDFNVRTVEGRDVTDIILYHQGYTLLLIAHKLSDARSDLLDAGLELGTECVSRGIQFFVLTSSPSEEIGGFGKDSIFCVADEVMLKTMIRTNPGYILIKDGTIIGKWSAAGLPATEWFTALPSQSKND
jgi:uncharacterized membrane protein YphA (DoxX/SURF4 family)